MKKERQRINILIDKSVYEQIINLAEKNKRTINGQVEVIIEKGLESRE